jgi:hypothetical protein
MTSFPGFGDGRTRMAACLRLTLVSIVIARWSKNLFAIFCYFWAVCTAIESHVTVMPFSKMINQRVNIG